MSTDKFYWNNNSCDHKNLKYFGETNKVVCLDCGEDFYKETNYPTGPVIPYTPPSPFPDYPLYPTVTWNKIDDNTN